MTFWSTEKKLIGVLVKPEYIDLAGTLAGGVLLSQIVYWHRPDAQGRTKLKTVVAGELWLAKPYGEWYTECRLSPKQIRKALHALEAQRLVRTRIVQRNKVWVVCIQLQTAELEAALASLPKGMDALPEGKGLPTQSASITEEDYKQTKPQASLETRTREEQPMKAKELMEKLIQKQGSGRLDKVWQRALAEVSGKFQKPTTMKEFGQFKRLNTVLGADAECVVDWTVRNWIEFVMQVASAKGLYKTPNEPVLEFFSKYFDVAVQMMAKEQTKPLQSIAKPFVMPTVQGVKDVPATLAEVQALMKEMGL